MLKKFKERLAHKRRIAQTRRELYSLTDAELADIGINRYDIEQIAAQVE